MRPCIGLLIALVPLLAIAQTRRHGDISYAQPQDCSMVTRQNPMNPYAWLFRDYCERINAQTKQTIARIMGRPQPSTRVVTVPAHGSEQARRYGVACMGGLVMLRIKGGWEQALDSERRYFTCRAA